MTLDGGTAGWFLAAFFVGYAAGSRVAFREMVSVMRTVVREGVESLRPAPPEERDR